MRVESVMAAALGLSLAALVSTPAQAGSISECRSRTGETTFTSQACPAGTVLVKERKVKEPPPPPEPRVRGAAPAPQSHGDEPALEAHPLMARGILSSRFARALSELSTLKVYLMTHFAEMGEWPSSPADLGLDSRSFHTEDIASIDFRRGGEIVAVLRPELGDNLRIWLRPVPSLGGASTRWECRTNIPADAMLPGAAVACQSSG